MLYYGCMQENTQAFVQDGREDHVARNLTIIHELSLNVLRCLSNFNLTP